MVTTDITPFMEEAVAGVLEAMCFVSVEGPSKNGVSIQADWIRGELDFVGPPSGSFGIAVPTETALMIAANFLGDEESMLTEAQIVEVVCELTNMICGSLLSHLDPKKAFTLSSPRHDRDIPKNSDGTARIYGVYRLDEGLISSWIEIQEQS